jgi:ribosome maturation factor RimP
MERERLAERVRVSAQPLADAAGLDLVEVAIRGEGPRRLVRVVVDRKGGVDLDRCAELSQELGPRLEELSELDGQYALEVSSPGVDYPLRDQRAFDRVEGRTVLVHRLDTDGSVVQLRGAVRGAEAEAVVLEVDGERVRVPYDAIARATQSLPW